MILFKYVEHADKEIITSYTLNGSRQNSDLSFSNLYSWRSLYNTRFAIIDSYLLLKFRSGDVLSYMMPIGSGDLKKALDALMEDAHREGQPFYLTDECTSMRTNLDTLMPGQFQFSTNPDYADYIYLRSDLATLAGKRFQSKRNHVNKFKRIYQYSYAEMTPDRIWECFEQEEKWRNAKDGSQNKGGESERISLICALGNFETLGLKGGILYVDGKIVAFTFGMPINQQTFDVQVEKADTLIDGAYAMINYEFANRIPEQYIYINREEDWGIEGLRKAKLSYRPAMILEKNSACLTAIK